MLDKIEKVADDFLFQGAVCTHWDETPAPGKRCMKYWPADAGQPQEASWIGGGTMTKIDRR